MRESGVSGEGRDGGSQLGEVPVRESGLSPLFS